MDAKKYIRTFAGDMVIVKKGGVPDLAPLEETSPAPAARPVPSPSLPPSPSPSKPTPPPSPPERPTPLETYAGDFSDRMKETHASPATVLAAEQDAAGKRDMPDALPARPASRKGLLLLIAGIVLLLAGGGGLYAAYTHYLGAVAPVALISTASSPIFVEEQADVSGTGLTLMRAIKQSATRPLASGAIRLLSVTDPAVAGVSIISVLQIPGPDIFLRNIRAGGSVAGIIHPGLVRNLETSGQNPFFILSVESYRDTFAGLLAWEPVLMRDLEPLFPPATEPAATSSPAVSGVSASGFRDEVINNHDARVFRDGTGRSLIVYGYWNQETLIIARDPASFSALIDRLAASHARP